MVRVLSRCFLVALEGCLQEEVRKREIEREEEAGRKMCLPGEGCSNTSDSEEKRRADWDREVGERRVCLLHRQVPGQGTLFSLGTSSSSSCSDTMLASYVSQMEEGEV